MQVSEGAKLASAGKRIGAVSLQHRHLQELSDATATLRTATASTGTADGSDLAGLTLSAAPEAYAPGSQTQTDTFGMTLQPLPLPETGATMEEKFDFVHYQLDSLLETAVEVLDGLVLLPGRFNRMQGGVTQSVLITTTGITN